MDVTIVGSGTLLPDDTRRSPGHLVRYRGTSLLLDCGSGVLHGLARDGLAWDTIDCIAVTHFHTDHLGDLAPLLWAFKHGVPKEAQRARTLLGPPGLDRVVAGLSSAFGDFVLEPGERLHRVELGPGGRWEDPGTDLVVLAHGARHTEEAISLRVETDEGSVGYTGDTGPHPPLAEFFHGVDVLICECSVPDQDAMDNHLSPSSVAELAVAAAPETLLLTHLYPGVERKGLAERIQALGYGGQVLVGSDGLRVQV